jgi:glycosyltransferase involved in cell wall biosynthesis
VRIGIDMLPLQSPGSRSRGVGRFSLDLVRAFFERGAQHEYVLYVYDGYPTDKIPEHLRATQRTLVPERIFGQPNLRDAVESLARRNPDRLDALLLLNPFELCHHYDPPAAPLNGLKVVSIVYDLIPFLFPDIYLADARNAAWNYRRLNTLRSHDLLLAISESTRADCLRMLDVPPERVVTIGGAADGAYFTPDRSLPTTTATRDTLRSLGIARPFVFSVAGIDPRKNLPGLIEAFGLLPVELRQTRQLVITCFLREGDADQLRAVAARFGVSDALVLTDEIPDAAVRVLYQRCSLFVLPSLYEGLGLPLLEAMHCAVPVVGGKNSSQIEVVGDAGLLANAQDPADLAGCMRKVLEDTGLARTLANRGRARAAEWTWNTTADRALEAISRVVTPPRLSGRRERKSALPRVAFFSPWPPQGSGIADYAMRLTAELKQYYEIHLFHAQGFVPEVALRSPEFRCHDYRLFPKLASVLPYRGVIYQMGNSPYHGFVYEMLTKYPGVVALHDFNLAAFHFWRAHQGGVPMDNFRAEVEFCYPDRIDEIVPRLWGWTEERGGLQEACSKRNLHMNRRVLALAQAVIVHSPWCVSQVAETDPELVDKMTVVPMGATQRAAAPERKHQTRDRFGLPPDALLFGSFGILANGKMNVEAIDAFQQLAPEFPDALLIFVGQDWEGGQAAGHVRQLGLADRVRFLGRQGAEDFLDLMAAVDIGVALRRPPTYGETSAALLDLLRTGVPTIINDVATFSGYPDHVVRKVRWSVDGLPGLIAAMRELAMNPSTRCSLSAAALAYVRAEHTWSNAAVLYSQIIESLPAVGSQSRSNARPLSLVG